MGDETSGNWRNNDRRNSKCLLAEISRHPSADSPYHAKDYIAEGWGDSPEMADELGELIARVSRLPPAPRFGSGKRKVTQSLTKV